MDTPQNHTLRETLFFLFLIAPLSIAPMSRAQEPSNSPIYERVIEECAGGDLAQCARASFYQAAIGDKIAAERLQKMSCQNSFSPGCSSSKVVGDKHSDEERNRTRNTFYKACFDGDSTACITMGKLELNWGKRDRNYVDGLWLLDVACNDYDNAEACLESALAIKQIEPGKGKMLLGNACDKGSSRACYELAWEDIAADKIQQAKGRLWPLCNKKDTRSCLLTAVLELEQQDFQTARFFFSQACQLGDKTGCHLQEISQSKKTTYLTLTDTPDFNCDHLDAALCLRIAKIAVAHTDSTFAMEILESSCQRKDLHSCKELAQIALGLGVWEKAEKYLEFACEIDHSQCEAKGLLSNVITSGDEENKSLLRKCTANPDALCLPSAFAAELTDRELGTYLKKIACERREPGGCAYYRKARSMTGVKFDDFLAFRSYCEQKDSVGCLFAGRYKWSYGEKTEAASYFQQACDSGNIDGCFNLDIIALNDGKEQESYKRFSDGCEKGSARGCYLLGLVQEKKGNQGEAKALYQTACRAEDKHGCHRLATLERIAGNMPEALQYYNRACASGYNHGCLAKCAAHEALGDMDNARLCYKSVSEAGLHAGSIGTDLIEGIAIFNKESHEIQPINRQEARDIFFAMSDRNGLDSLLSGLESNNREENIRETRQLFQNACASSHGQACILEEIYCPEDSMEPARYQVVKESIVDLCLSPIYKFIQILEYLFEGYPVDEYPSY